MVLFILINMNTSQIKYLIISYNLNNAVIDHAHLYFLWNTDLIMKIQIWLKIENSTVN